MPRVVNGPQAELVRVPLADHSTTRRPSDLSLDDAVLLAELLSTVYEVEVRNGHVCPGDNVVLVGAGPIGLAAVVVGRALYDRRFTVEQAAEVAHARA